jgi:hypothetical protein
MVDYEVSDIVVLQGISRTPYESELGTSFYIIFALQHGRPAPVAAGLSLGPNSLKLSANLK